MTQLPFEVQQSILFQAINIDTLFSWLTKFKSHLQHLPPEAWSSSFDWILLSFCLHRFPIWFILKYDSLFHWDLVVAESTLSVSYACTLKDKLFWDHISERQLDLWKPQLTQVLISIKDYMDWDDFTDHYSPLISRMVIQDITKETNGQFVTHCARYLDWTELSCRLFREMTCQPILDLSSIAQHIEWHLLVEHHEFIPDIHVHYMPLMPLDLQQQIFELGAFEQKDYQLMIDKQLPVTIRPRNDLFSKRFIDKYKDLVNWSYASGVLSLYVLKSFSDLVDWSTLSSRCDLSVWFVDEFFHLMDWPQFKCYHILSEAKIRRYLSHGISLSQMTQLGDCVIKDAPSLSFYLDYYKEDVCIATDQFHDAFLEAPLRPYFLKHVKRLLPNLPLTDVALTSLLSHTSIDLKTIKPMRLSATFIKAHIDAMNKNDFMVFHQLTGQQAALYFDEIDWFDMRYALQSKSIDWLLALVRCIEQEKLTSHSVLVFWEALFVDRTCSMGYVMELVPYIKHARAIGIILSNNRWNMQWMDEFRKRLTLLKFEHQFQQMTPFFEDTSETE